MDNKNKKFKMPSAYTILFSIIAVVALLSWIVPAGKYDYLEGAGKPQPIPGTYKLVDANPQGLYEIVSAPIKGFADAQDIALFILVIGGFLGVIMKTGAIDALIESLTIKYKGREKFIIPILMIILAIGGTTFGLAEETIAFYPLVVPFFLAAGFDTISAVATVLLGAGIGVLNSTLNPFCIGVASGFAGISLGDGIFFRITMLVIQLSIAIIYVMKYAEKVQKEPNHSIVYETREEDLAHFIQEDKHTQKPELTPKRKLILWVFALTFIIMILGVIPWAYKFNITIFEDTVTFIKAVPFLGPLVGNIPPLGDYWFSEMTVLFLVSAIICGKLYGMNEKHLIGAFMDGARDLLGVALIVGLSRGITIVMNASGITDTVLHLGEGSLAGLGKIPFIIFTYIFYLPMSFLIPSTSGLATVSMPIMAPLGGFVGVDKSLIVTAYANASGIVNLLTPTSAVVMGGIGIARVGYGKWLKFAMPIVAILFITTVASLIIGTLI